MMRRILSVLGIVLIFVLGFLAARQWYARRTLTKAEDNATVLLERIRTVAKLVTVEGYFSEVYNYKDYWGYDLPFLRKKALLRVRAKVSVGYDLGRLKVDVYADERRVVISGIPEPEILSIDHDIDYYDISEGTFNSFSEEDYNRLNQNAKRIIEEKARASDLLAAAEKQGNDMLDVIRFMAESAGYRVEIRGDSAADQFRN